MVRPFSIPHKAPDANLATFLCLRAPRPPARWDFPYFVESRQSLLHLHSKSTLTITNSIRVGCSVIRLLHDIAHFWRAKTCASLPRPYEFLFVPQISMQMLVIPRSLPDSPSHAGERSGVPPAQGGEPSASAILALSLSYRIICFLGAGPRHLLYAQTGHRVDFDKYLLL